MSEKTTADRRAIWFLMGLVVSVVSLYLAFRVQEVRANPFASRSGWSWFAQPSEVNAEARLPELSGDLHGLSVSPDGQTIWLVGAHRTVCYSRDSGRSWVQVKLPVFDGEGTPEPEPPKELDKKESPQKKAMAPFSPHVFMQSPPAKPKYEKPDSSPKTVSSAPPVGSALTAVSFTPDGREGWIVGTHGVSFHSIDRGESWTPIRLVAKGATDTAPRDPNNYNLIAVRAMPDRGVMADNRGCLFECSQNNQWVWTNRGNAPSAGAWIDPNGFPWLAGWTDAGKIHKYEGEDRKRSIVAEAGGKLRGITGTNAGTIWVVGENGKIVEIQPPAEKVPRTSEVATTLQCVAFADEKRGIVGGDDNVLRYTTDAGAKWSAATVNMPILNGTDSKTPSVLAVALTGTDGWAVGTQGLLLRTADAGQSWHRFTRPQSSGGYRIFVPAPWLLLALTVALVGFWKSTKAVEYEREAIDDSLTPDRPLEPGQADVMKLGDIAAALSRFLRNENTLPPLTAAVTGKWGTGKSSLMNLLKKDLEAIGFCPVWFNAWHHSTKNEDQLLAGLLANVIRQGTPSWFSAAGLLFYFKLLYTRFQRLWFQLLIGAALTAAALANFGNTNALESNSIDKLLTALSGQGTGNSVVFGVSGLIGVVLFLRSARQGLQSFGVDTSALLTTVASRSNLSTLDAKASFRLTFANQFREVTTALNPRTLVIFIDDLDRCRPENVLEIMESINFLSSSGDCFIFLGMDRDYVLKSVALGFEKVADAMSDAPVGSVDARENRLRFAASYLEKLINFEVPIPTTDALKRQEFLLPKTDPVKGEPTRPKWQFPLAAWKNRLTTFALIASLIVLPLWVYNAIKPARQTITGSAATKDNARGVGKPQSEPMGDMPALPANPVTAFAPAPLSDSTLFFWVAVLGIAGMAVVGVVGLLRQPDVVVRDSSQFTQALRIWIGQITAKRETARSLKQFINRLRYFAMRMRTEEPEPTYWDRLLWSTGLWHRPSTTPSTDFKEADLVQWSVLYEVCPAALENESGVPKEIADLMKAHAKQFERNSEKRDEERNQFRELTNGFRN